MWIYHLVVTPWENLVICLCPGFFMDKIRIITATAFVRLFARIAGSNGLKFPAQAVASRKHFAC